jgi:parvulin-like peptidyl-prolyl isomerase
MRRYYEEHKGEFVEPEQIRLTCITIQAEEGKEEEAKKKAEEILKRIKGGEDIKDVAKEISDKGENMGPGGRNGGDTGFFSRDSFPMAKEFTEAAFSLEPGQMYDGVLEQDVRGTKYYMIFRCEEKKPQRQKEFDEEDVQRTIKREIEQQKKEEYENEWISSLKEKAKVKLHPERIPEDTESAKKSPDKIVLAEFKWGGKKYKITLQDVEKSIGEMSRFKRDRYKGKEGREKHLNEMLEEMLKIKAAEDKGYDVDLEIARKTTEYLNQLMVEKIVEDEVDAKVSVSEDEMRRYYEEHKGEFVEPEQIRLTCITIQAEEGKEEEAKKKAEEILKRIKGGEDIKDVAKEISDKGENMGPGGRNGGDTGFFSRDSFPMAKEFTEAAFSLEPGQMYDGVLEQDVRGTKYYMIFRCEEKKPQRQKEFDEEDVQRTIKRELEKKKRRQLLEDWLNGLKEKANFKIYFDRLPSKAEEEKSEE